MSEFKKETNDDANTSDNEFYDAIDNIDPNNATDGVEKNLEKLVIENDSSDNDDFVSIKPSLDHTKEDQENSQDKPFVPLHEQLNNELRDKKAKNEANSSENNEDEFEDQQKEDQEKDEFYVDEVLLKEEDEKLNEQEKQDKLKEAQENKKIGNDLFKEEKFTEALVYYTKSLRLCPLSFSKERSVFYSNRSKENENCIKECTKSIELDPEFVKPLLRRAECYQTTDKLEEALEDYKKLIELDPKNSSHKYKCIELEEKIKERNEKLKEEMMGKLKDLGNMILKPFGLSTNNFQFVQDPNSGSYSVNFKKD